MHLPLRYSASWLNAPSSFSVASLKVVMIKRSSTSLTFCMSSLGERWFELYDKELLEIETKAEFAGCRLNIVNTNKLLIFSSGIDCSLHDGSSNS
jgi:hypothetical protein